MKDRSNLITLLSRGATSEALHMRLNRAEKNLDADSTIPKGKRTLGTKRSEASPSEPTETTNWIQDEIEEHGSDVMKARTVYVAYALLVILAAVAGAVAWLWN